MVESAQYARLFELRDTGRTEEAIHYAEELLAEASDPRDTGSLLTSVISFSLDLGRVAEARLVLQRLKGREIPDLEVRLNAEFYEPRLLIQEGRAEEGLTAFAAMLDRDGKFLREDRFRYLYEEIQCRRAWALIELSRFADALPIARESMSYAFEATVNEQRMRYALAVCLDETGDAESAAGEYFHVIGFNLRDAFEEQARYRLSALLLRTGAFAQARKQLEMILEEFADRAPFVPRSFVYEQLSIVCRSLCDEASSERYKRLAAMAKGGKGS